MDRKNGLCLKDYSDDYVFQGIDLIKFICAYLICMIHIPLFQGVNSPVIDTLSFALKNGIARIAVPFFFSASGFLLFRKINLYELDKDRIKKQCYKLLFLLGLWTTLLIVGFTDQLWYLSGLVIVILLFSFLFSKHFSFKFIFIISGLLYLIGLLGDSYSGIVLNALKSLGFSVNDEILSVIYNSQTRAAYLGLFSALVFFTIGVLFVYKPIKINLKISFVGFILSISLLMLEAFTIRSFSDSYDHNMYISLIPTTFFLFYIATHIEFPNKSIFKRMRAIGVLVFFLHVFVYAIIKGMLKLIDSLFGIDLSIMTFLLVVLFATALAIGIERLSQKERFKILKILYS